MSSAAHNICVAGDNYSSIKKTHTEQEMIEIFLTEASCMVKDVKAMNRDKSFKFRMDSKCEAYSKGESMSMSMSSDQISSTELNNVGHSSVFMSLNHEKR